MAKAHNKRMKGSLRTSRDKDEAMEINMGEEVEKERGWRTGMGESEGGR